MSIVTRTVAGTGTDATQARSAACSATPFGALASRRTRWRPRMRAIGAGAGPQSSAPAARSGPAAGPSARATSQVRGSSVPVTMIAGEPAVGRHQRAAAGLGLGAPEALVVAGQDRLDRRVLGLVGLDQRQARALGAAGAAGDLADQLEGLLGRPQVAALQPEVGVDHPDEGQHAGSCGPWRRAGCRSPGRRRRSAISSIRALSARGPSARSEERIAMRASGQSAAASSASRSTPGPSAAILPSTLQDGQAVGIGLVAPHWWQTSRLRKRCSTMRASHWSQPT